MGSEMDIKWERIAASLNTTVEQVQEYYAKLLEDVAAIDSGHVPPNYPGLHPTPTGQIVGSKRSRIEDEVVAMSALCPSGPMGQLFRGHSDHYAVNSGNLAPNYSAGQIFRGHSHNYALNSGNLTSNYPVLGHAVNSGGHLAPNYLLSRPTGQIDEYADAINSAQIVRDPSAAINSGQIVGGPSEAINSGQVPPNYPGLPQTGHRMGRWSPEEHNLFVEGVNAHGTSWQLIQRNYVRTRTAKQIRGYAGSYFAKQAKKAG